MYYSRLCRASVHIRIDKARIIEKKWQVNRLQRMITILKSNQMNELEASYVCVCVCRLEWPYFKNFICRL